MVLSNHYYIGDQAIPQLKKVLTSGDSQQVKIAIIALSEMESQNSTQIIVDYIENNKSIINKRSHVLSSIGSLEGTSQQIAKILLLSFSRNKEFLILKNDGAPLTLAMAMAIEKISGSQADQALQLLKEMSKGFDQTRIQEIMTKRKGKNTSPEKNQMSFQLIKI
jgi:HEAT repeat protein